MSDEVIVDSEEQLLAELEAEEAAAQQDTGEQQPVAAQPAEEELVVEAEPEPVEQAEPEPTAPAIEEIRIPKPRLDAVLRHNRELELENARLKGLAEGVQRAPVAQQPVAPQQPQSDPLADRLIAIESGKDTLWERYDKGEIGYAEMKKTERALDTESVQVREAMQRRRNTQQAAPAETFSGDVRLAELTEEMAKSNLWIGSIPPDYMVASVMPLAERLLKQRGIPFTPDAVGTYRIRQATIEVAKAMQAYKLFAPRELWPEEPGMQPTAAAVAAQPAAPQRVRAAALSPEQVRERLQLSRQQPPSLAEVGTRMPGELITPKDIEGMSEDELAQLSDAELERLAPSHAR